MAGTDLVRRITVVCTRPEGCTVKVGAADAFVHHHGGTQSSFGGGYGTADGPPPAPPPGLGQPRSPAQIECLRVPQTECDGRVDDVYLGIQPGAAQPTEIRVPRSPRQLPDAGRRLEACPPSERHSSPRAATRKLSAWESNRRQVRPGDRRGEREIMVPAWHRPDNVPPRRQIASRGRDRSGPGSGSRAVTRAPGRSPHREGGPGTRHRPRGS